MAAKNYLPELEPSDPFDLRIVRLKKRADFLSARKGARSHERAFVLQLVRRAHASDDILRIGFTVTKKIGNAVTRNRIKRRLRQAVKQAQLPRSAAGHDAVLIARKEAEDLEFKKLVDSVTHAFANSKQSAKNKKLKDGVAKSIRKGQ